MWLAMTTSLDQMSYCHFLRPKRQVKPHFIGSTFTPLAIGFLYEYSHVNHYIICQINKKFPEKVQILINIKILWLDPESIEWFIEDQAFLRSYDSVPRPPPPPPPISKLSLFLSPPMCRHSPVELTDGLGGGRGAKSYTTARKPGPL